MTILQSLDGYYARMERRGEVVPPGWSTEPIGFVISLNPDGSVARVSSWLDEKGKRGRPTPVPKWFTKQGIGSTPFFLWENTAYALGVSEKNPDKTRRDHEAFRKLHLERLAETEDEELLALRRFVEAWTPDQFVELNFLPKMMAFNVAFRLDKLANPRLIHQSSAARALIEKVRSEVSSAEEAVCLVSGEKRPVVRLHPKIKGVNGTANPEVPLVSFNLDAFTSYGKEQGFNAPTSEEAAFRYGTALNALLDRGKSRNRLKRGIGDATVVFWAESAQEGDDADKAAEAAERAVAEGLEPPDDAAEAFKLYTHLKAIAAGKSVTELDKALDPATRFHVLGLAPNAARLSVRFWLSDSLDHFIQRIAKHYEDLCIEPQPVGWTMPSVNLILARTTALLGKFDNIPNALAGEVMRAVLTGQPYPRTLLAAVITRLRAGDAAGYGWHAAVLRACINRGLRGSGEGEPMTEETGKKELPVGLDPDNKSVAYQLGRLFSVMESAQYEALGRVNAPIGVRYYAAASATPARVFGTLLRGLKNHVADARKRNKGGWIDGRVSEILGHVGPDLPRTLSLEDQARFAVGYYHESGQRRAKATGNAADTTETEGDAP